MVSLKKLRIADRVDWWPMLVVVRVDELKRWKESAGGADFHKWVREQLNAASR